MPSNVVGPQRVPGREPRYPLQARGWPSTSLFVCAFSPSAATPILSPNASTRTGPGRGARDRKQEYAARNRGETYGRLTYATEETFVLTPLPCWARLSPERYRER